MRERDKAMMGMLKHIGIEKGKPYNPDAKTKEIFRRAVIDAYYYMQQRYLTVEPEELYWPDRRWRNVFYTDPNMGFSWDWEGMLDYDNRSVHPWFTAIYFPSKVTARPPTMYLATARDKDGKLFEAGKTYKLTVPEGRADQQVLVADGLRHGDLGLHLHARRSAPACPPARSRR